jgi:hypothetical protein
MSDPQEEINRLRAGEDPTPRHADSWPTPGQFIAEWNSMTAEERLTMAGEIVGLYQERHTHLIAGCTYPAAKSWHERSDADIAAETG